ncbi:MAG: PTS sugar transporter subunit IIC [Alistipes sp.]|nr:PTS sugar transporter subunit IIC [Alistipes sp.]MBO7263693.1 PTS sugar transporter subunit IIC [Alistipes sp.]
MTQSNSKRQSFFKVYVVDALSYMAMGLFCSLILGLIIGQIAKIPGCDFLSDIARLLQLDLVVGGSIGLAIALGMKRDPLVTISAIAVGALGYSLGGNWGDVGGNPIGAYLAAIVGIEAGSLVSKRTPIDIIITPLVGVVVGGLFAQYCCVPIGEWVMSLGEVINRATMLNPFIMGIIISVSVGCILTLPISSAALCISIGLSGLAAGAATAGCCAQMIGFAVISFKDNGVGGLISQGLGTSMLQIGNIARKPIIWLAPTLAGAVLGPISTMVFKMTNSPAGAGMGTAGLVGPIGCWDSMSATMDSGVLLAEIVGLYFIAPAVLSLIFHAIMVRLGWVKTGDMKLQR